MKTITQLGIDAQKAVVSEMRSGNGVVPIMEFAPEAVISEMLGTDSGPSEFVEQVTYSSYQGRENVPLLYGSIYRTISDANLPKSLTEEQFGPLQAVFLQFFEGGEVKFGALGAGTSKTVTINTWTTGMEYNEDIVEFNETWKVTEIAVAFGEAYNKVLNHLHLGPIVSGSFVTTGSTVASQKTKQEAIDGTGAAQLIAFDTDIATTLATAISVLPKGTIMLVNSADENRIDEAIASAMYADYSPALVKKRFASITKLVYDGDSAIVRKKVYEYAGVSYGEAFLIVPKQNFVEYEKHGLRVDSNDGDLTRLILSQVVGRTRRGVLAALSGKTGAIKIALEV